MKKWVILLLVLSVVVISQDTLAQGCSQCRMLSEQSSELDEASFTSNINYGILYLMILPYLLIMFLFRKRIFRFFKSLTAKKA